jgi:cytochrome c peroxidase
MKHVATVAAIGAVAMLASVAAYAHLRDRVSPVGGRPASEGDRAELAAIGKRAFFDPRLSEPPGTSCASCHDPSHGYAGDHGSGIGVALGSRPGHFAKRSTPSVLYLRLIRRFHFHWEEDAPLPDAFGGFFWDGRVDSLAALTRQPLLNAEEMGNVDVASLARKIDAADYAGDLRAQLGPIDSPDAAADALGKAVEAFLLSDEMHPFTSKYDDVLRGEAAFTSVEARGMALFKDPAKGNCAFCHKMNEAIPDPERSPFSDYGFETVGVPRNGRLPATKDPSYFDLGLCEHDDALGQTKDERFCGAFRTPSLRNVAVRPAFMHNGAFTKLRDVVAFYATRATEPVRWYGAETYDDLPARYRDNVNDVVAPYDRKAGGRSALDDDEIDAIVAFLGTLTDRAYR